MSKNSIQTAAQVAKYHSYFAKRITALHDEGKITDTKLKEFKSIRKELINSAKYRASLDLFMAQNPPEGLSKSDIPTDIMKILNKSYPNAENMALTSDHWVGMVLNSYNNTVLYQGILADRMTSIYDEVANNDAEFAEKLLCLKGLLLEQQIIMEKS